MMTTIMAAACAATVLLMPHATADPGNTGSGVAFADILDEQGIPYTTRADAVMQALSLCSYMSRPGASTAQGILTVSDDNPEWTIADAAVFVREAHKMFCPGFDVS